MTTTPPAEFDLSKKNKRANSMKILDVLGTCGHCGAQLDADNTSILQSGNVKHIGCWARATQAPDLTPPAESAPTPATPSTPDTAKPEFLAELDARIAEPEPTVPTPTMTHVRDLPVFDDEGSHHQEWQPPTVLPPVNVPSAPTIESSLPSPALVVPLPPVKPPKPPKAPRVPKVKPAIIMWWATTGNGRWGPFASQHEAWEGSTLTGSALALLSQNLMAGQPPIYNGMQFVNVGAVGMPRWVPVGLVVYPERAP